MQEQIHAIRVYLEQIHPAVPAVLMVLVIWIAQYAVRKWFPNTWEAAANLPFPGGAHKPVVELARKVWQALPSVATGALLSSMAGDGSVTDAVLGAILGAFAPLWHELLKVAPIPYQGTTKKSLDEPKPS